MTDKIRTVETIRHMPKYTKKDHGQGNQILASFTLVSFAFSFSAPKLVGFDGMEWVVVGLFTFSVVQLLLTLYAVHELREMQERLQAVETRTEITEPAPTQPLIVNTHAGTRAIPAARPPYTLPNDLTLTGAQMDILDIEAANNENISGDRLKATPEFWEGVTGSRQAYYVRLRKGLEMDNIIEYVGGNNWRFVKDD